MVQNTPKTLEENLYLELTFLFSIVQCIHHIFTAWVLSWEYSSIFHLQSIMKDLLWGGPVWHLFFFRSFVCRLIWHVLSHFTTARTLLLSQRCLLPPSPATAGTHPTPPPPPRRSPPVSLPFSSPLLPLDPAH